MRTGLRTRSPSLSLRSPSRSQTRGSFTRSLARSRSPSYTVNSAVSRVEAKHLWRCDPGAWEAFLQQALLQFPPLKAWHAAVLASGNEADSIFAAELQGRAVLRALTEGAEADVKPSSSAIDAMTTMHETVRHAADAARVASLRQWRRGEKELRRGRSETASYTAQLWAVEASPMREVAALRALVLMRKLELQAARDACASARQRLSDLRKRKPSVSHQLDRAVAIRAELEAWRNARKRARAAVAAEALQTIEPLNEQLRQLRSRQEELAVCARLKTCRARSAWEDPSSFRGESGVVTSGGDDDCGSGEVAAPTSISCVNNSSSIADRGGHGYDACGKGGRTTLLIFRGGHILRVLRTGKECKAGEGEGGGCSASAIANCPDRDELLWIRYEPKLPLELVDKVDEVGCKAAITKTASEIAPRRCSIDAFGGASACAATQQWTRVPTLRRQFQDHLCRVWLAVLGVQPGAPQSPTAVLPARRVASIVRRLNVNLLGAQELAEDLQESSRFLDANVQR
eukprot:TRINITY_DN13653_c0_g1_i1.p1 TRINITY_DN13653_c0_g1~~TRINITY_DN13653_c0_g1_i1.p1  ORF type:complete len:516 (+),score=75.83 TRINITY_DN13653_c0_g1_i1:234-1781(+)